jgi:hypothetical protein
MLSQQPTNHTLRDCSEDVRIPWVHAPQCNCTKVTLRALIIHAPQCNCTKVTLRALIIHAPQCNCTKVTLRALIIRAARGCRAWCITAPALTLSQRTQPLHSHSLSAPSPCTPTLSAHPAPALPLSQRTQPRHSHSLRAPSPCPHTLSAHPAPALTLSRLQGDGVEATRLDPSSAMANYPGRSKVYLPYYGYKEPQDEYAVSVPSGDNLSFPKKGACNATQELGDGRCLW